MNEQDYYDFAVARAIRNILNDDEFGKVMKAYFDYLDCRKEPEFSDKALQLAYDVLKTDGGVLAKIMQLFLEGSIEIKDQELFEAMWK